MKKTNKIIGALTGTAIALAVFVGYVSNVSANDNTQGYKPNYRCMGVGMGTGMHFGRTNGNMRDSIATFLGMDSSQFMASRQAGKSMVQIAKEQGKSEKNCIATFLVSVKPS